MCSSRPDVHDSLALQTTVYRFGDTTNLNSFTSFEVPLKYAYSVVAVDIDNDGSKEAIFVSRNSSDGVVAWSLLEDSNELTVLGTYEGFSLSGDMPISVHGEAVAWSSESSKDLLSITGGQLFVHELSLTPTPHFLSSTQVGTSSSLKAVVVADVDGSGAPDAIVTSRDSWGIAWNRANVVTTLFDFNGKRSTADGLAYRDVTGDGHEDVM